MRTRLCELHPVCGPVSDLLLLGIAEHLHRRFVRCLAIAVDRLRRAVALQRLLHEAQSCLLVAGLGDVAFEDLALLIDRASEIDPCTIQVGFAALRVT